MYKINCSQCDSVYYGQTERSLKTRVSEHKKAVVPSVHECHHRMDFGNFEVVYHQRLFLESWMSVEDPNARNDDMAIPEVYLTIRPVARKGYEPIAHEAKPNGLLTRGP